MHELNIPPLLTRMVEQLRDLALADPVMIGVFTGGVWVAEELHQRLQIATALGEININFYRDDFTRIGLHPRVSPSNLPFGIDDRNIILVDDVLHTGRTIRAALNEIFDYGRPARVTLAVLIDRGARELPIQADVVGERVALSRNQHVELFGPSPLRLEIQTTEDSNENDG